MLSTLAATLSARPRRTLLIVLAFVLVAGVVGGPLAGSLTRSGGFAPTGSDSQVAIRQLARASGVDPTQNVVLLVATPRGPRAAAPRIAALGRRLSDIAGVGRVTAPAAVSRTGRDALVAGALRGSAYDAGVAKAALAAFESTPGVTVGGSAVTNEQIGSTVTKDLGFAEILALPLLVVLSLVFFRGRATLMPLAVGVTTVLGTFLVLTGVNQVYGLSVFALNLVIGLGLGLSVDYTLFLVTRFREELARGESVRPAIATTMRRAGATVAFSATTVSLALCTLVLFPQGFLKSMGLAGAVTALVAAATALVISPALLGLWGAKLGRAADARAAAAAAGRWYRLARWVMRRPGPVAIATALVMLAAATPALTVHWSAIDTAVIPQGQSSRTVGDAIAQRFGGAGQEPVTVAITAPASDGGALRTYAARVAGLPGVAAVAGPRRLAGSTWELDARISGDPGGVVGQRVVERIRALRPPFATRVTGQAATFLDQQAAISAHLPLAIGLLALLTFLVLWLMTDSFVLPVKAIVMNALTVGAALSPLVLIYQHGNLSGLLGYTPNGGVEPTDFLVAATLVFALATDYGVFLLGRIKEARQAHPGDEREAVATGLAATGRVVTAAAILLAVAIGAFSTSSISFIQQIGIAVATGALLDALVVRSLLVPSLMALLGRWNWWSPAAAHAARRRLVSERPPAAVGPVSRPSMEVG